MTNSELKRVLQELIDTGMDDAAVAMLMEASVQGALKLGVSLRGASISYSILAAHHEFLKLVAGEDLNLLDAIEAEQKGTPMTVEDLLKKQRGSEKLEEEIKQFTDLLKGIDGL